MLTTEDVDSILLSRVYNFYETTYVKVHKLHVNTSENFRPKSNFRPYENSP